MIGKKFGIGFGIIFICAVFAIAIVIGIQRQEKVQAAIKEQEELLDIAKAEADKKAAQELAALAPNGSPRSYIDDIKYFKATHKDRPLRLTAIGSSVTAGAGASDASKNWLSLLVKELKKIDGFTSISYSNEGYGGYTSGQLLAEGKVDKLIELKPDMVIFEICVLNDHGQSVPLKDTLKNIDAVVELIKKGLPETKVILISPNPKLDGVNKNLQGITLADYVSGAKQLAEGKGWDFIDIYDGFVSRKIDMNDYTIDGVHPNDKGYELWFEILKAGFEKKK